MKNEPRVRITREIAVARKTVFEAWLDPEALGAFMKPAPGVTVTDQQVDARVGGAFQLTMIAGSTRIPVRGEYRRIDRFDRLEFTWLSSRTLETSLVTLAFEELAPNKTRLTLEHVGFPDEESRQDHDGGWAAILEALSPALSLG